MQRTRVLFPAPTNYSGEITTTCQFCSRKFNTKCKQGAAPPSSYIPLSPDPSLSAFIQHRPSERDQMKNAAETDTKQTLRTHHLIANPLRTKAHWLAASSYRVHSGARSQHCTLGADLGLPLHRATTHSHQEKTVNTNSGKGKAVTLTPHLPWPRDHVHTGSGLPAQVRISVSCLELIHSEHILYARHRGARMVE